MITITKNVFLLLCAIACLGSVAFAETVTFNTKHKVFHTNPTCPDIIKCTTNCIPVDRAKALKRGGRICMHCAKHVSDNAQPSRNLAGSGCCSHHGGQAHCAGHWVCADGWTSSCSCP